MIRLTQMIARLALRRCPATLGAACVELVFNLMLCDHLQAACVYPEFLLYVDDTSVFDKSSFFLSIQL